jgi:hypothetical protein
MRVLLLEGTRECIGVRDLRAVTFGVVRRRVS